VLVHAMSRIVLPQLSGIYRTAIARCLCAFLLCFAVENPTAIASTLSRCRSEGLCGMPLCRD